MSIGLILVIVFLIVLAWSVFTFVKKGPVIKIDGVLEVLGHAQLVNGQRKYSVIKIGNHTLNDIFVPDGLDSFMQKGLGQPIAIFGQGNVVWAVQLEDGKSYITNVRVNSLATLALFVCGIILLPAFGIGVIPLLISLKIYGNNRAHGKVKSMLPEATPV